MPALQFSIAKQAIATLLPSPENSFCGEWQDHGTVIVPALQANFLAREEALHAIRSVTPEFRERFFGKIERPTPQTSISYHTVKNELAPWGAMVEIGRSRQKVVGITQMLHLLWQTEEQKGPLLANGYLNCFLCSDRYGTPCFVASCADPAFSSEVWRLSTLRRDVVLGEGHRIFFAK